MIAVYLAKRGFKVDVFEARKGDFQVSFDSVGSVLEGRGADVCLVCHSLLNPFNPKISLVILQSACYTIFMTLVWRIWHWNLEEFFSLFSLLVSLILF